MKRLILLFLSAVIVSKLAFPQPTNDIARHIAWGPNLPARCRVATGDIFFKTTATVGAYSCGPTNNNWTAMTGGTVTSGFDTLLSGTNTGATMTVGTGASLTFSGSGIVNSSRINGATLGTTTATAGNVLIGSGSAWVSVALSGDITVTSAGVTAIGATKVTNGMLAGSIAASKLVGTDIAIVGTITAGVWNGTPLVAAYLPAVTVYTNQSNTYSTGAQDFGSATSFKVRVAAGCTATTNGFVCYDSTANMLHAAQSSADAFVAMFTITPTNNNCVKWVVSGSNYKLGDAGSACGSGGGSVSISADGGASYSEPLVNFVSGTGISVVAADVVGTRVDVTVSVATADVVMIAGSQTITGAKSWAANTLILTPGANSGTTAGKLNIDASGNFGWYSGGNVYAMQNPGTTAGQLFTCSSSATPCPISAISIGGTRQYLVVVSGAWVASTPLITDISAFSYATFAGQLSSYQFQTNSKTSTYQVLASDFAVCKVIPVASGTFTITLVASGAQPGDGQCVRIFNYGSGVITISRSGQNINGVTTSQTLAAGSASAPTGLLITSNGTDYFAQPLGGGGGGTGCVPSGSSGQVLTDSGSGGCTSQSGVTVASSVLSAAGFASTSAASGSSTMSGLTSGGVAWAVNDVAGTAIAYILPSTNGAANQFLMENGSQTCPTLASSAPATCHAVVWTGSSGSGNVARVTSPTFVTPVLGAATATSINGLTITSSTGTFTLANGKTLTVSNTLTFTGTDSSSVAFGGGGTATKLVASGAKALATSAISSGACSSAQTDTATGAATTDAASFTFSADPTAVTGYSPTSNGMLTIIPYITSNTMNFKVCNNTASSITPGAVTINWLVVRTM